MLRIRFQVSWLEVGRSPAADRALMRLLAGVREGGSLASAARLAGLSYRHAWGTLAECGRVLGRPLVALERGRGARLSPLGEKLLRLEERMSAQLAPALDRLAGELKAELAGVSRSAQRPIRIHASHDLALARLPDIAAGTGALTIELQVRGSHDSVAALARGDCDIAGFHAPHAPDGRSLDRSLRRWLRPRAHRLFHFARRELGLMVKRGNPKGVAGVADLARRSVRFVNRQSGSGTRATFDRLIGAAGIEASRISGYALEEFTHLAVAATVAGGMADAGFGIRAAAVQYALAFVPLVREDYYLACNQALLRTASMKRLLALIRSAEFNAAARDLPGYDFEGAGTPVDIQVLLGA